MTQDTLRLTRHATSVDRDDPWLSARLATAARMGCADAISYSKTRRIPAPIEDRFTLIRRTK